MKLVDLNVLLYAINEDSPPHDRAKAWLESTLSGTESIGFPWVVLLGFLRLSTRPAIFSRPLSVEEALSTLDAWLSRRVSSIVQPTHGHQEILRQLMVSVGTAGNLTTDAHLAALSIEHGAELCSCDADFARFPGVRWTNPLA